MGEAEGLTFAVPGDLEGGGRRCAPRHGSPGAGDRSEGPGDFRLARRVAASHVERGPSGGEAAAEPAAGTICECAARHHAATIINAEDILLPAVSPFVIQVQDHTDFAFRAVKFGYW